jgi:hypothetical protein
MATGDDPDDTLERATHQALTEFCERHPSGLVGAVVSLFPIQNKSNTAWSEHLVAIGNPERLAYHAGWAFMACYAQHMSSMFQEVTLTGAYQRLRLEEYDHQVSAKNCLIKDIQKGNRELLQENHRLEAHAKELNDELMRTYCSRDFKTDLLGDTHTRLQHAQDELTVMQNYVHHLEAELHERDEQLEASQTQAIEVHDAVDHLQELIPKEPEEDLEEINDICGVEDNYITCVVRLSRIPCVPHSLSLFLLLSS